MAQPECLFCNLLASPKPGWLIYEDPDVVAFRDIHPQAPTHVLVIPRQHFPDLTAMEGKTDLVGKMYAAALSIAKAEKIDDGFRTVVNVKQKGGQTVFHVHMHVLGGLPKMSGKLA